MCFIWNFYNSYVLHECTNNTKIRKFKFNIYRCGQYSGNYVMLRNYRSTFFANNRLCFDLRRSALLCGVFRVNAGIDFRYIAIA